MAKGISLFFGLCLAVLFIIGLATPSWTGWLTWLDLAAAVSAFCVAVATSREASPASQGAGPIAISVGVLVLWIIALATGAQSTQTWLNFFVGIVYLLSGIGASVSRKSTGTLSSPEWRRSA